MLNINFSDCTLIIWENRDGWRFETIKNNRARTSIEGLRHSKKSAIDQAKAYAENMRKFGKWM